VYLMVWYLNSQPQRGTKDLKTYDGYDYNFVIVSDEFRSWWGWSEV
jgi:hypothetical protein